MVDREQLNSAAPQRPGRDSTGSKPKKETKEETRNEETKRAHQLFGGFGVCLIFSILLYLALHSFIPANGVLPGSQARDAALTAIVQAESNLTDTVSLVDARLVLSQTMTTISRTVTASPNVSETAYIDRATTAGDQALTQVARDQQKARLKAVLLGLNDSVRSSPALRSNGAISSTLARIEGEINKSEPDTPSLQLLFDQLAEAVKAAGELYFWSDGFGKWVEFAFWGWFGTLAFILMEIRRWYPLNIPGRRFRDFTPWYFDMAVKGPFVSLLIMFFITNTKVDTFGVTLAMGEATIELQIFLAGVLGFYSRVANKQLDLIVQNIFKQAWAESFPQRTITILPPRRSLELDGNQQFEVDPPQDVVWSHEPHELGSITEGGLYTAPSQPDKIGQTVTIKAMSVVNSNRFATAQVELVKKFEVKPVQADLKFNETLKFSTEPDFNVTWGIEPGNIGEIDPSGKYTAPPKGTPGEAQPGREIVVTATTVDDPKRSAKATVTLQDKE